MPVVQLIKRYVWPLTRLVRRNCFSRKLGFATTPTVVFGVEPSVGCERIKATLTLDMCHKDMLAKHFWSPADDT